MKREFRPSIRPMTLFVLLAAVAGLLSMGCAPVTYNRYQTADTLGRGEMKLIAATNVGQDLGAPVAFDLTDEMDDELLDWSREHPGNEEEIHTLVAGDIISDVVWFSSLGMVPDVEIIYAIGVHDLVDLEVRITTTGYIRFNTKVKLHEFGKNGVLSLAPGVGYRGILGDSDNEEDEIKDTYDGYALTGELPLLIGWQFEHVMPYLAPTYIYHRLDVDFTREVTTTTPDFKMTTNQTYDFHNAGLIVGCQFKWSAFVITPEVVALYSQRPGSEFFFVYPGVSLGALW